MDRISGLSDELLVKILFFLPTKVAVSTSILSKRWEFLWMWLPKLEYDNRNHSESKRKMLQCFFERNLPLHRAPVIERLRFQFTTHSKPEDVKLLIVIAVSHIIRKLKISYNSYLEESNILPSSLYTRNSLVTLKLRGTILLDVPRMVCLPSLKTLQLTGVTYFNEDCLQRLLSNCPVLEDLLVDRYGGENMRKFTVIVPSLQRLSLYIPFNVDEFVINTPSLKYLKLVHYNSTAHYFSIENMPKLMEADVDVQFPDLKILKSLIGSITSVKRLKFCMEANNSSEVEYGDGFVFNRLTHLELCLCQYYLSNVLVRLLKDSPNLRELDLYHMDDHDREGLVCWTQPSSVPECMLSNLQTFNWLDYFGRPEERDLAVYILENSSRLKTATIWPDDSLVPKLEMITELALSSRASATCKLVFK